MTLTTIKRTGLDGEALDRVFTIGASGTDHYTFQGEGLNGTVNDPTLYLTRGKTYRFENGSGGHPIRIQSTSGASGTAYNTGVTNNAGSGTVIVEVQHDAPDVLYYQCTSHANMGGTLYITGALADGGVTTAKLADDAVTAAKIADGTIQQFNLASNAVTTAKINANAVTAAKIADGTINTTQIADEAITLAKLAHGTSSNNGKFLRANNGADPTFETVTTDLVADTSPQLGGTLDANGQHITIQDSPGGTSNSRLKIGNGDDLQIFHNGTNSIISNTTGDLSIRSGNNIVFMDNTADETLAKFVDNGAVELYHDNVKKLETTSSGATVTGTVVADNTSGRNIIINGDMRVSQRGTSASYSSSANAILAADRWYFNSNGTTGTVARVAEAPDGSGFKYSLKATNSNPVGSIAAGNYWGFIYKVERQDIRKLGYGHSDAKPATLSFWIKGSLTGRIGVKCVRDSKIFSTNVDYATANTWQFVEIVIPADTSTVFNAGYDTSNGFDIAITGGAGSNFTSGTTGGSWIGFHTAYTAGFTAAQQGAYLTTNGATLQITGVQLEVGSKATPFAFRPIGEETALCERYYQALVTGGSQYFANGYYLTNTTVYGVVTHRTRMRAQPSLYQTTGTDYYYIYRHGSGDGFDSFNVFHWSNGITGNFRVTSGVSSTAGTAGGLYTTNANARIAFDAEI